MLYRPLVTIKLTFWPKKCHFWAKISNFKCPDFGVCHSLRGLTYMSVFSSSSTIRIYKSTPGPFLELDPPGRSFRVCSTWIAWIKCPFVPLKYKTQFIMIDHKKKTCKNHIICSKCVNHFYSSDLIIIACLLKHEKMGLFNLM